MFINFEGQRAIFRRELAGMDEKEISEVQKQIAKDERCLELLKNDCQLRLDYLSTFTPANIIKKAKGLEIDGEKKA